MIQIIPSILVQSEQQFLDQVRGLHNSVDAIQLDIADGEFVPNATWANPETIKKTKQKVELHLMVQKPLEEIKKWIGNPAIYRVFVHYESSVGHLTEILAEIHAAGWQAGIVLNPETPVAAIEPNFSAVDVIMFMGVHPGFQGQELLSGTLQRVQELKRKKTNHIVELDGGVNEETLPDIIKSGVDAICPGNAIFGNDRSPEENVKRMKQIINESK